MAVLFQARRLCGSLAEIHGSVSGGPHGQERGFTDQIGFESVRASRFLGVHNCTGTVTAPFDGTAGNAEPGPPTNTDSANPYGRNFGRRGCRSC